MIKQALQLQEAISDQIIREMNTGISKTGAPSKLSPAEREAVCAEYRTLQVSVRDIRMPAGEMEAKVAALTAFYNRVIATL